MCVGENDGIASWRTMENRANAMKSVGIDTEFHKYPGLGHGFGLGTGTAAEGWIDDCLLYTSYDKSYPEAMEYLLSGSGGTLITSPPVVKKAKPFELPPKNDNMRRVFAYLTITRKIDKDVLQEMCIRDRRRSIPLKSSCRSCTPDSASPTAPITAG